MTQDFALDTDSSSRTIETWWAQRRLRYNVGLLIAGPLGFGLYAAVVSRCIDLHAPGDWEITILATVFQSFAFLVVIGVANLCYYLGLWSERLVHPTKVATYRKIAFRLGFWFSVMLPFTPSAVLFVSCALHAGQDKKIIVESARTVLIVAALFLRQVLISPSPDCVGSLDNLTLGLERPTCLTLHYKVLYDECKNV